MKAPSKLSGVDFYWAQMRAAGAAGFTALDIHMASNARNTGGLRSYIRELLRLGHIEIIGSRAIPRRKRAPIYAVKLRSAVAPSGRRAKSQSEYGRSQRHIWTAMRSLGNFTMAELAIAASTEECVISEQGARNYVVKLVRAGAVMCVAVGPRKQYLYRLKPSCNTGPQPLVCRDRGRTVFDPNKNRIISQEAHS